MEIGDVQVPTALVLEGPAHPTHGVSSSPDSHTSLCVGRKGRSFSPSTLANVAIKALSAKTQLSAVANGEAKAMVVAIEPIVGAPQAGGGFGHRQQLIIPAALGFIREQALLDEASGKHGLQR